MPGNYLKTLTQTVYQCCWCPDVDMCVLHPLFIPDRILMMASSCPGLKDW